MPAHSRIASALRSLFRKRRLDEDLDEELRSYLDLLTEEKVRAGVDPRRARREALYELGGVEQVKEKVRERRLGASLDTLLQDVRYAFRTLRKNIGFTVVAVLILAIGIGANTTLFTSAHAVLLRGVPFPESHRLVAGLKTIGGGISGPVSRVDYYDYREFSDSYEQLAALADFTVQHTVMGGGAPELVQAAYVTWNLFPALGVSPVVGRGFTSADETDGGAGLALISYGYWQSRFGGARDAVGSTLNLDGSLLTVIGVMPRDFLFLYEADVWRLVDRTGPFDGSRGSHSHFVVGRLKPGVSIEQAQGEADGISASLAQQYPESNSTKGLLLMEMRSFMAYGIKTSMLLLLATTALILLIACGNVAGLMLARGERRLSEMAMRSALGASRSRLLRQLVTESVVLTGAAGLLGIGIAYSLQDSLLPLLPSGELGTEQPSINMAALAFTLAISIATGLIVGIVPALRGTALKPAQQLRSGNHASESLRSGRLRSGLVVLQVALSVALLIGSALMVRSFAQLSRVELGFSTENLLTGQLQIQAADYPTPEQRSLFYSSLLEEVEALPGVESATLINKLPIMSPWQDWSIWRAELPPPTAENDFSAMARWVPPGYFQTMGMQLLAGRDIAATDVPGSPYVIVVSERVARTLFEDADPVGRQVRIGWSDRSFEVIGVVRDARVNTLRGEPDAAAYMASAQIGATRMQIAVRSSGDPMLLVGPIEGLLRRKDPNVLFAYPRAMSSIIDSRLSSFRIVILSLSLFSVLALALTAIGLYGILAYHVSQRTNEIGVRLAMGASNGDMLGMVLRKGLALVGIGLVLGVAAAYPGTLLVRQLLFETQPIDLAAYMVAVVFLGVVATLACLLPAWRATRVDVVDVLRIE